MYKQQLERIREKLKSLQSLDPDMNLFGAGLLRISDFGCGISMNLVLNGPCSGEIWTDDRANRNGIYPDHYWGNTERLCFLDWYELWLDRSINELREQETSLKVD